jgi:hypothetical protein
MGKDDKSEWQRKHFAQMQFCIFAIQLKDIQEHSIIFNKYNDVFLRSFLFVVCS